MSSVINLVKSWLMLYGPLERLPILRNLKRKIAMLVEVLTILLRHLEIFIHPCII